MDYEYVFGTLGDGETVRVKGPAHTELSGFQQVTQEYPGETVTDRFRVARKLKSDEDRAGNCYDWYEIDRHYRTADKTPGVSARVDELAPGVEAAAVAFCLMAEAGQIDAATAGERADLFSAWAAGVDYQAGQLRRWEGALYRCIQPHRSQEGWEPENVLNLWKLTYDPAEAWPEWSQPLCAGDEYGQGAQATHGGVRWVSDVDGNVWEPGVYGWSRAEPESDT